MKIQKVYRESRLHYTKGIRFFKDGTLKTIVFYSKSKNGKWLDEDKTPRRFGYFKSHEDEFNARAIVIGSHKFSILTSRD